MRKKTEFTINYNIATSWTVTNFNTDPIIYQYVIFEKDIWPTGDRSSTHTPYTGESAYSSLDAFFSFKSADDEYNLTSFYANKSGMLINIPQAGGNKTYNANNFMTESKENKDGIEYNITNF